MVDHPIIDVFKQVLEPELWVPGRCTDTGEAALGEQSKTPPGMNSSAAGLEGTASVMASCSRSKVKRASLTIMALGILL